MTADLSNELVVCEVEQDYKCYTPGGAHDPATWAELSWSNWCENAKRVPLERRVITKV